MTVEKVRASRTLMTLPAFRGIASDPSAVRALIDLWTSRHPNRQRRAAVRCALALQDPDIPDDAWNLATLGRRRRALADQEGISADSVRDREDAALEDLVLELLDASMAYFDDTVTAETNETGIVLATLDFYRGVPWDDLFMRAHEVDIFFTYGRSWRRSLTSTLAMFFARPDTHMRVILPSITQPNVAALPEIAKRAGQDVDTLVRNIREAYAYFLDNGADVWTTDTAELYASYRFDDDIVVTMYNHQRGQTEGVPTLLCRRGGTFFEWFTHDFAALLENDELAWRVTTLPD